MRFESRFYAPIESSPNSESLPTTKQLSNAFKTGVRTSDRSKEDDGLYWEHTSAQRNCLVTSNSAFFCPPAPAWARSPRTLMIAVVCSLICTRRRAAYLQASARVVQNSGPAGVTTTILKHQLNHEIEAMQHVLEESQWGYIYLSIFYSFKGSLGA